MNPYLAFMVGLPIGVIIGAAITALFSADKFDEIERELKDALYYREVLLSKIGEERND